VVLLTEGQRERGSIVERVGALVGDALLGEESFGAFEFDAVFLVSAGESAAFEDALDFAPVLLVGFADVLVSYVHKIVGSEIQWFRDSRLQGNRGSCIGDNHLWAK
jgi:hypothetical protein